MFRSAALQQSQVSALPLQHAACCHAPTEGLWASRCVTKAVLTYGSVFNALMATATRKVCRAQGNHSEHREHPALCPYLTKLTAGAGGGHGSCRGTAAMQTPVLQCAPWCHVPRNGQHSTVRWSENHTEPAK